MSVTTETTTPSQMRRTAVNPTSWGQNFLMHQAEVVQGAQRVLHCSGQVDLVEDPSAEMGLAVGHADMDGQLAAILANLDALLDGAGMTRADIVRLTFYTTDVQAALGSYGLYAEWIGSAGVMPPQSLIGVAALVDPGLLMEIEMTAMS